MSRLAATLFAACVTLTATLTAGCAENQETLIVLMAPLWTEGECSVDPSSEDALLFGVLDVAYDTPYLMPAIILNNSGDQSSNDNNTGVISNEIQLKDAEVTIDCPQRPDLLDGMESAQLHFKVPLSTNSILPGETAGVAVEVLPLSTVRELRTRMRAQIPGAKLTVRANVVFSGTRSGNDVGKIGEIDARDFSFPIELCDDCLLRCSGCDFDMVDFDVCTAEAVSGNVVGGVCGNAQDAILVPAACEASG